MTVTYKSLHQMVVETIESQTTYSQSLKTSDQLKRNDIAPLTGNALSDITSAAIVTSIQVLLSSIVRPRIISGLYVKATSPISNKIIVEIGSGVSYGRYYELKDETTLTIPFDGITEVFYIVLFDNTIMIDRNYDFKKLVLAKIIVPRPDPITYVRDNYSSDDRFDAYIVNQQDYYLHGDKFGNFEEDTVELLRDNISPILADNLIGNIRLTEDLKIINSSGTLELDSREMRLNDVDGTVLMKLNRNGTYFYNDSGSEIAKFSTNEARIGNILVTKNSVQSQDFVSGPLGVGFQIQDNGDAEFNSVKVRGKLTTSVFEKETISSVGGSLLIADSDVLDVDMTSLDTSTITISGDTNFSVGDFLRIKDGVDDEWFEVTDVLSGNVYEVTRDKAGSYSSNSNPEWKKGTAVINYGTSTDGMIYMTASDTDAPYMSVINTGTTPWVAPITRLRVGNLNGFLGYTNDAYGIGIGTTDDYLKYDPVNGLRIKGNVVITGGTTIPVTFYQATEPGSGDGVKDGDYWVDTDDSNELYIYQGSTWISVGGASGINSFNQSATTSGEGIPVSLVIGDLWLNTDDNRLYRALSVGADAITVGEWELTTSSLGSSPSIDAGLYLSSDYIGYYNGSEWDAFIKNDGSFYFGSGNDSGSNPNHICWDGINFCIRGNILADDISAGTICLDRGVIIQSNSFESGVSGCTVFNTNGIYSYDTNGDERFSVVDGSIVAQDIRLQDPDCVDCYSFLYAGALRFHDEYGDVPYVKRICSGTANTGTTVCLPGWKAEPKLQVSINTLYSYNSAQAAQCQQWAIYYNNVACYCNSGLDYGYKFDVHSELRLASGQAGETLKQVAWGTSVCTATCTCSVIVRNKFCMWCNGNAPSNYWAGCLCYVICFRVVGAANYCCSLGGTPTTYNYLQPHSSASEVMSISEQSQTLTFPCMATWEILACCTGLSWHDTGICSSVTQYCLCTRTVGGLTPALACAPMTVLPECVTAYCHRWNGWCNCVCTQCLYTCAFLSGTNPDVTKVYCVYVCAASMCMCSLSYFCQCQSFYGSGLMSMRHAATTCSALCLVRVDNTGVALLTENRSASECWCFCRSSTCEIHCSCCYAHNCAVTYQDLTATYKTYCFDHVRLMVYANGSVCTGISGDCYETACCSRATSFANINYVCFTGLTLYQCYCVVSGNATSCCMFCNHSLCNTFGCYCVLDCQGIINWLAVAYQ